MSKDSALHYVFGYSVMNDISARDNRRAGQWIYSKGQDTYAPFGPVIVTADEIPDPHNLDLSLTVNGVTKQSSNTRHMLFKVDTLIADISAGITLEPGDIIATGTPAGVGAGRSPQEWMWPGDVVVAKHRYSAFHNTDLDLVLRSHGIRTVALTGVLANVCVKTTAREAFVRDYYTVVVGDCCAAYSQAEHEAALKIIDRFFGEITQLDAICSLWHLPGPPVRERL